MPVAAAVEEEMALLLFESRFEGAEGLVTGLTLAGSPLYKRSVVFFCETYLFFSFGFESSEGPFW